MNKKLFRGEITKLTLQEKRRILKIYKARYKVLK